MLHCNVNAYDQVNNCAMWARLHSWRSENPPWLDNSTLIHDVDVTLFLCNARRHIASNMPAAPIPVPIHIVTIPHFCLVRRMPCTSVAARIAPVAPNG